jgi:hypothetical protein
MKTGLQLKTEPLVSGLAISHQRNWRKQGLLNFRIADPTAIALFKHKGTAV